MITFLLVQINLVHSMSEKCASEWAKVNQSPSDPSIPEDYALMYQYSGVKQNDLGNFDLCNDIPIARYVVVLYSQYPVFVQTFCGPIVCTKDDYKDMIGESKAFPHYDIYFPHVYQNHHYREYSSGAIVMITLMLFLAFLGILSSVLDIILSDEQKNEKLLQYLLSFSIIGNFKRLFVSRSVTKLGKKDTLQILEAIRVLSFFWVVSGHSFSLLRSNAVLSNFPEVTDESQRVFYIFLNGFYYSVDTFFWLSGFLMTYFFIIELERDKNYTVGKLLMMYFHRYLRMTPVLAFIVFFYLYMTDYLGQGPLYTDVSRFTKDCHDYWYSNLIYLNNFIPNYNGNRCIGVSWYLPNDMCFSILGPIIVLLYVKKSKLIGWILVPLFCIMSATIAGILADHFDLQVVTFTRHIDMFRDEFDYYYIKPYIRITAYALGMAGAFIVYTYRKHQEANIIYDKIALFIGKSQENLLVRMLTFAIGVGCININMMIIYKGYRNPGQNMDYSYFDHSGNIAFYTFERFTFGLGITLIFLPLLLGHFTFISDLFTGSVWEFLSRFTYVAFLLHYDLIQISYTSQKVAYNFDVYTTIKGMITYVVIALFCSIPIVLLIEMPAANIEKLAFSSESKKPIKEEQPLIKN